MTQTTPNGSYAVMAQRHDPVDSLDFFPTPPWATRALFPFIPPTETSLAWEPAAGAGHMSEVLCEKFLTVIASDIHDYGHGYEVCDFRSEPLSDADWIITNPPFNLASSFANKALERARHGVALLVRTAWLEGAKRHAELFSVTPPSIVALFSERVPMVKGRWDPKASTATSYAWVIWYIGEPDVGTKLKWIPPGRKAALTSPNDVARFAGDPRLTSRA